MNLDEDKLHVINLILQSQDSDPEKLIQATNELTKIINDNDNSKQFHYILTEVLIDPPDLPPIFFKVSFIYLKNFVSKFNWSTSCSDLVDRLSVAMCKLLQRNNVPEQLVNLAEKNGNAFVDLFKILFFHKWTNMQWSIDDWSFLVENSAWLCINKSLKAASELRLRMRMKILSDNIKMLIPVLLEKWSLSLNMLQNDEYYSTLFLTKLLITCLKIGSTSIISTVFQDKSNLWQKSIESCIVNIRFIKSLEGRDDQPIAAHLSFKFSKLFFYLLFSSDISTRSSSILNITEIILSMIIDSTLGSDRKTARYLLIFLYKTFSVKRLIHSSDSIMALTQESIDKVKESLKKDDYLILKQLTISLIQRWMKLINDEVTTYIFDPEGCFSAGGVLVASEISLRYDSLFDVDLQEALTPSEFYLASSKGQPVGFDTRHAAEKIFTPLCQSYDFWRVIKFVTEEYYSSPSDDLEKSFEREAILRALQLSLRTFHYRSDNQNSECQEYFAMVNNIVSIEMEHGDKILSVIMNQGGSNIGLAESINILCFCRSLCLSSRFLFYNGTNQNNHRARVKSNAEALVNKFANIMKMRNNKNDKTFNVLISIRLCAAKCLKYTIEHSLLPEGVIRNENVFLMLDSTIKLIEDASECETKVYLLSLLKTILEMVDFLGDYTFADSVISLLSSLWSKSSDIAMKASILDTISVFLTLLNCSSDPLKQTQSLIEKLESIAIDLICSTIGNESLFENILNLWSSLVKGQNSMWNQKIFLLLDFAFGLSESGQNSANIFTALDSVTSIKKFIEIVSYTISLIADPSSGCDDENLKTFFMKYTEIFWSNVLVFLCPQTPIELSRFDLTCSNHVPTDEDAVKFKSNNDNLYEEATPENLLRREFALLLCDWLTIVHDIYFANESIQNSNEQLISNFPSLYAAIALFTRFYIFPLVNNSTKNDTRFGSTQILLTTLCRFTSRDSVIRILFQILTSAKRFNGQREEIINTLKTRFNDEIENKELIIQTNERNLSPSIDLVLDLKNNLALFADISQIFNEIKHLLILLMEQFIERAENCPEAINRRSMLFAAFGVFVYLVRIMNSQGENEEIIKEFHNRYFEGIVNSCIQCLNLEDKSSYYLTKRDLANRYPVQFCETTSIRKEIAKQLQNWEKSFSDSCIAKAFFDEFVDPAFREELNTLLSSNV